MSLYVPELTERVCDQGTAQSAKGREADLLTVVARGTVAVGCARARVHEAASEFDFRRAVGTRVGDA